MKIKAVINVGLLLKAIKDSGFPAVEQAAAACKTAPANIHMLLNSMEISRGLMHCSESATV